MWCSKCSIETNDDICPLCGADTIEDLPVEVYWCEHCRTPIIQTPSQVDKGTCPICQRKAKYMTVDLRPVFPEERLLVELLLQKEPHEFSEKSVWASNNRYYVDGVSIAISNSLYQNVDAERIVDLLEQNKCNNTYEYFDKHMATFVMANRDRLNFLIDEAHSFIQDAAHKFPEERIVVSFSGGKDSTVTADLASKALSNPSLVHIFGDTTLEFPSTIEYAHRFRDTHHDRYIEELGTLYLLHYRLASNKADATAWYYFFNEFNMSEFTRDDFVEFLQRRIRMEDGETNIAILKAA